MMTQRHTKEQAFGETPELGPEQGAGQAEERRGNIRLTFETGGAMDWEELKQHLTKVCDALCRVRYYDTLAVLLRGFGSDDDQILKNIKDDQVARGMPIDSAWDALEAAGISFEPGAMVTALREVDSNYRRKCEADFDDIPF